MLARLSDIRGTGAVYATPTPYAPGLSHRHPQPYANTDAQPACHLHTHPHSDGDRHARADLYANAYPDCHAYAHVDAHTYLDVYAHRDFHADIDFDPDSHGPHADTFSYTHGDPHADSLARGKSSLLLLCPLVDDAAFLLQPIGRRRRLDG